jgi:hypothetical protein
MSKLRDLFRIKSNSAENIDDQRQTMDKPTANSQQADGSNEQSSPPPLPLHQEKTEPHSIPDNLTADAVYDFYRKEIFPAIMASFPILIHRFATDSSEWLRLTSTRVFNFLLPAWSQHHQEKWSVAPNLAQLWEQTIQRSTQHSSIAEFMLNHFDTNGDGHISPSELLNMTEMISRLQPPSQPTQTFWAWFSREWPLMDWKIGLFLWRSFGGLLVVIAFLSIVPGRLHRFSGKILRWPILAMTYFLVIVELIVYTAIRLVIRIAELLVATPKHRALRRKMAQAESYKTWYQYAAALDLSQKRDKWQRTVQDQTSSRYNWALIRQLMEDMRYARAKNDSLLALAVLQQCTRKNTGGIMSEDLFSYTNTGEPKFIVKEFIEEVTKTIRWITDEALIIPQVKAGSEAEAKLTYEKSLNRKVRNEKEWLWKSLLGWAMLSFGTEGKMEHKRYRPPIDSPPRPRRPTEQSVGSDVSLHSTRSEGIPGALPRFHREQLIAFLKRARAAYGRTALCLSGGAMMGLYHFGHLQGLMETDCLPNIISGTSAGAVVAAIICTRTDEELRRDLVPEIVGPKMKCFARPWGERVKSVWKNGNMFSSEDWLDMIQW